MSSVIVLTQNWQYWDEVDVGKVVKWFLKGKIRVVAADENEKIKCSLEIKRPLVVQLLKFAGYKIKSDEVKWSKEAVFQRDKNICQFWHYDEMGKKFKYTCTADERTLEHIIPVSRGGTNTFENTACACTRCNVVVKGNKTPEEAGLKLIRQPFVPRNKKGQFATIQFTYDPNKVSHRFYMEKILGQMVE